MKKQLWHAVIYFFLNISFILNFWSANQSIHLNSWHHSHKKEKDSLETQVLSVDILAWTWNIWGGHTENTSKQQKMVVLGRNCLVKMTLRLFLAHFCCYDYGISASEAVQKIKDTRVACQLTKTAAFIATHLWKNIFSSILPVCWRYKI